MHGIGPQHALAPPEGLTGQPASSDAGASAMGGESVPACTSAMFEAASLEATSLAPESPIAKVSGGTSSKARSATNGRTTRTETRLIGIARRSRPPPRLGQERARREPLRARAGRPST